MFFSLCTHFSWKSRLRDRSHSDRRCSYERKQPHDGAEPTVAPIPVSCPGWCRNRCMPHEATSTWWWCGDPGSWRSAAPAVGPRGGSDAQGHVTEQPLLGAAVVALSEGGNQLVFFWRHVQTLVAVHVQQGEPLKRRRINGGKNHV